MLLFSATHSCHWQTHTPLDGKGSACGQDVATSQRPLPPWGKSSLSRPQLCPQSQCVLPEQ